MSVELANAYISIVPSFRGVRQASNAEFSRAGEESGGKFKAGFAKFAKIGVAGGLAAAAGIGIIAKQSVDAASDVSESASKVGVVFKKQAGQIIAASNDSAAAMGLSKGAYLEAAGTLGNLLVSLDIAPKAAADMSQQMVKLAGDLASFNNVSPEEALAAIKSGLTGETEPLKAFGVNMNDATLKTQALKLHLIKTTKDAMSPQTKALAAQALIMAQTKTAQGDFARTSGGLANQQRILAAQLGDVKAQIGSALLPVMVRLAKFTTSNVLPAFRTLWLGARALFLAFREGDVTSDGFVGVMERVGVALRGVAAQVVPLAKTIIQKYVMPLVDAAREVGPKLVQSFKNLIQVALPLVKDGIGPLAAAFKLIVPAVRAFGTVVLAVTGFLQKHQVLVRTVLVMVGAAVTVWKAWTLAVFVWSKITAAAAAVQAIFNAVLAANPIGIVVIALAALAAGFVYAYKHSETFRNIVSNTFNALKTAAQVWWSINRPIFVAFAAVIRTAAAVILWWWRNVTVPAFNAVTAAGRTVGDGLMWAWHHAVEPAVHGIQRVVGLFRAWVGGVVGTISNLWKGIGAGLQWAWDHTIGRILKFIEDRIRNVKDALASLSPAGKGNGGGIMGGIKIGIKSIPGFAAGTSSAPAGPAIVGERGPEILNLRRGDSVTSNRDAVKFMGRSAPSVYVQNPFTGEYLLARAAEIADDRIDAFATDLTNEHVYNG